MAAGISALTEKQEARRQRVIGAAMTLGADGGYDAVQMRDVATTADVALGTIYRYFASKDHLLAAAMVDWTDQLQNRLTRNPAVGDSVADRVVYVLRRACRALERQPKLTAALVKALAADDADVDAAARQVRNSIASMTEPLMDDVDPYTRTTLVGVIGHVWYSSLLQWANGRRPIRHVGDELEKTVRLVLEPAGLRALVSADGDAASS